MKGTKAALYRKISIGGNEIRFLENTKKRRIIDMPKRITTRNLTHIITSKMVVVSKVRLNYFNGEYEKQEIESEKLIESLEFLNESEIFAEAVDWTYHRIHVQDREDLIRIHGGRMSSYMPCTVDFELHMAKGVDIRDIEKKLLIEEEECSH